MPDTLLSIGEFAKLLGDDVTIKGAAAIGFSSIEIDSRKVQKKGLFFAIKGERDGHDFVGAAADNGASAAVVDHMVLVSIPQIIVPNTRKALLHSASLWRNQFSLPLAAIAGSNGKTTTTQMISSIFKYRFDTDQWLATQGNLNNDMGVSLTLWRMRESHIMAAIEAGMNHLGEMEPVVAAVKPTVGVVTNTMRDHQEFLTTLEDTARENGEVYKQLPKKGIAVINEADPYKDIWIEQAGEHSMVTFGTPTSDVHAEEISGASFVLVTPHGRSTIWLKVPGIHNINNAVCAAATVYALGFELADIKTGLEKFEAAPHRGQVIHLKNGSILIDDSYNANPDSMLAGIDMLNDFNLPKICFVGDMSELGTQSVAFHKEIGDAAREKGIDEFMCVGNRMMDAAEAFGKNALHFESKEEMTKKLIEKLQSTPSVVLVKASNSVGLYKVIDEIKQQVGVQEEQ